MPINRRRRRGRRRRRVTQEDEIRSDKRQLYRATSSDVTLPLWLHSALLLLSPHNLPDWLSDWLCSLGEGATSCRKAAWTDRQTTSGGDGPNRSFNQSLPPLLIILTVVSREAAPLASQSTSHQLSASLARLSLWGKAGRLRKRKEERERRSAT